MQRLHDAQIEVVMMTGDARVVAEAVGRELDIDTVLAQVLPEDKAANIEGFRTKASAWRWSATA